MQIKRRVEKVQTTNKLIVAFDVSLSKLDCYSEYGTGVVHTMQDRFANNVTTIEERLQKYYQFARDNSYTDLLIVAEPSGGYERKLLETARRLGFSTTTVNPESVSKFKVVESNDSSKTDIKDPRIIFLLTKLGKTLHYRVLTNEYRLLRKLNKIHDSLTRSITRVKNQIEPALRELFVDHEMSMEFLYNSTGRAFIKCFHGNPYTLIKMGYSTFTKELKKGAPRVKTVTIDKFWNTALSSSKHKLETEYIQLLEHYLLNLWHELETIESQIESIKIKMIHLYQRLRLKDKSVPATQKNVINEFNLSRLLAETGPLSDFPHRKMLLRFLGLNINERQSGTYIGQNRISKKGRSLGRCICSKIVFRLLKKEELFGTYYHEKKDKGMPVYKAQTAVMRKFIKMIYGLSKSKNNFEYHRVFTCKSQYQKVA